MQTTTEGEPQSGRHRLEVPGPGGREVPPGRGPPWGGPTGLMYTPHHSPAQPQGAGRSPGRGAFESSSPDREEVSGGTLQRGTPSVFPCSDQICSDTDHRHRHHHLDGSENRHHHHHHHHRHHHDHQHFDKDEGALACRCISTPPLPLSATDAYDATASRDREAPTECSETSSLDRISGGSHEAKAQNPSQLSEGGAQRLTPPPDVNAVELKVLPDQTAEPLMVSELSFQCSLQGAASTASSISFDGVEDLRPKLLGGGSQGSGVVRGPPGTLSLTEDLSSAVEGSDGLGQSSGGDGLGSSRSGSFTFSPSPRGLPNEPFISVPLDFPPSELEALRLRQRQATAARESHEEAAMNRAACRRAGAAYAELCR